MRISIQAASDLGLVVRAVRRHSRVRIDDLAATAGVSKQFTQDVEHGKPRACRLDGAVRGRDRGIVVARRGTQAEPCRRANAVYFTSSIRAGSSTMR